MSTETWPQKIEAFLTSDREIHNNLVSAETHQRRLDGAVRATAMLEEGASLGAALRAGGFIGEKSYPELDAVTKGTKLVISHWQCKDTPGYSPCSVDHQGRVWVWGDVGSWTGPYGNWCWPGEIVDYINRALETAKRHAEYERKRAEVSRG